jgi:lipopolysaccharide transport system ATP-binding protein
MSALQSGPMPEIGSPPCRLLILDDFFPNLLTGFRVAEFNALFRAFPSARCASIAGDYLRSYPAYAERYPELAERVSFFAGSVPKETDLVYCVGLGTLEFFRPFIETAGVPFAIELYPGFALLIGNRESEAMLDAAFASPCFRKVIVTQTITLDYIQRRYRLPPPKILYKFGGVLDEASWQDSPRFTGNDGRLELAFVANRYVPGGLDKGYDVFIDAARLLNDSLPGRVRFHLVGPWGPEDRPLGLLQPGRDIFFHGLRTWPFFRTLFRGVDAIVSPNRPDLLGRGSFDGFPTSSVLIAMACGVAAFMSDPKRLNHTLRVGREFVLIEPDPDSTAEAILRAFNTPGALARIGRRGRLRVRQLYSFESQMAPRIAALRAAAIAGGVVAAPPGPLPGRPRTKPAARP